MKITEVLEEAGVEQDEKARRVLNTSTKRAAISAAEIEAGVTLERLDSIGVPVFRYNTQITIHGSLPDFAGDARPAGYKAVFRNSNGTVGVKYVAIDAEKKETIVRASRLGTKGWVASLKADGLTVGLHTEEREACIAAFRSYPRQLVCGGVTAGVGAFGGYWVIANVGAIPEANLWAFIGALWGVRDQAHLDELDSAQRARYAEETAKWEAARKVEREEEERARAAFVAAVTLPRLSAVPSGAGQYVEVVKQYGGDQRFGLQLVTIAKRGPSFCYAVQPYPSSDTPRGFKKFDGYARRTAEKACQAGKLFAVR